MTIEPIFILHLRASGKSYNRAAIYCCWAVALIQDLNIASIHCAVTIGNSLDEEIAACDLIICGNSGVAMNALSGGRPVAYLDTLDGLNFDYNGFVESGLICHVTGWSDDIYRRLRTFYERPEWRDVMRSYDASYESDLAALKRSAGETVRPYLSPTPGRDQAESRARSRA